MSEFCLIHSCEADLENVYYVALDMNKINEINLTVIDSVRHEKCAVVH